LFHCILLYFSLFYHVFYRITVIGWSALAVVSRYCQILLLLLKARTILACVKWALIHAFVRMCSDTFR